MDYAAFPGGAAGRLHNPSGGAFHPWKLAAGLAGLVVSGGLAARRFLARPLQQREILAFEDVEASENPFVPEYGVEQVLIQSKPKPGPLQLFMPPPVEDMPDCLFQYGARRDHPVSDGANVQEAWAYGAILEPSKQWATPTSDPHDVLKGKLVCWDHAVFPNKLKEIEKSIGIGKLKDVERSIISVVVRDGRSRKAVWHSYPIRPTERPFVLSLDDAALDLLFRNARTARGFVENMEVPDQTIKEILTLANLGPTSANSQPARYVIVKSNKAKQRLLPALMDSNQEKALQASFVVIVAWDPNFYEHMPRLFPQAPARDWFIGNPEPEGTRSAHLQSAYLIMAIRAKGLDALPMAGFDKDEVDRVFLSRSNYKSLLLVAAGYGDESLLSPRNPRFRFEEIAEII